MGESSAQKIFNSKKCSILSDKVVIVGVIFYTSLLVSRNYESNLGLTRIAKSSPRWRTLGIALILQPRGVSVDVILKFAARL